MIIPSRTKLVPVDPEFNPFDKKFIPSHQELSPAKSEFVPSHPEFNPSDKEFDSGMMILSLQTLMIKSTNRKTGMIYRNTG
jgi:hypothetical protein